jgi:FOG: TPR repeat, SEL1 subfamily
MKTEIENGPFDFLQNADNELLLVIRSRNGKAESPYLLYDGGVSAILYKTSGYAIILNGIHEEVRSRLAQITQILVTETFQTQIKEEYRASVKIVPQLPQLLSLSQRMEDRMENDPEFCKNAIEYYRMMADNGNSEAQYQMALLLMLENDMIEPDYDAGLEYLSKAAEQGHELAQQLYVEEVRPDDDGRFDAWV